MIKIIFSLLTSILDPVSRIAGKIADAKIELAKSATDQERIKSQERVSALEARRDVMMAESGSRVNSAIRAGFAAPFVVYNMKLVLWDKVLGLGSTDPLSSELFQIELACIGFYFLYDITSRFKR